MIKVGLIGLGRHGARYAQHLLEQGSPARLVAVCRRDILQGEAFARKHQIRYYQDYTGLIRDPEVEAIVVVTPPTLTYPIARESIQHKKPLLIEKPLAASAQDAYRIVERASQVNVPIMTAHTLRYENTIKKLKDDCQCVGKWQYLSLTSRLEYRPHSPEDVKAWNGRGALLEFGIHLLDVIRFITGEEIREVYCEIAQKKQGNPENQIWGRLTTQSGIPCLLDVSRVSQSRMTHIDLIGETGQLRADWTTGTLRFQQHRNKPVEQRFSPTSTIRLILQDFIQALKSGTTIPISGEDGLHAIEIAEACYESAKKNLPTTLSQR